MRSLWLSLCVSGLSFLLTLAGLEIVLRFFPVQSYLPPQPVNAESPVARYLPDHPFVYSSSWNFQDINCGRTNAQGYVSDFDYNASDRRPLIAIIGDSYIEARMVPFSQTMQEKIRSARNDAVRVYAFAMNGAPLSQYLAFAKMARDTYRPDMMVFNIVSNDFEESFPHHQSISRFHYFIQDAHGSLQPQLQSFYRPSWFREMLSNSALVRYAYFHLKVTDTPRTIRRLNRALSGAKNTKPAAADQGPPVKTCKADLENSRKAVDAFLRLLPEYSGLPPASIVLLLDGQRLSLYRGEHKKDACFEAMRGYLSKKAVFHGYEIIDLHPVFERDYQTHKKRLDFTHDAHWNGRAHGLAAGAVLNSRTLKLLFNTSQSRP